VDDKSGLFRIRFVERRFTAFLKAPVSVRSAMAVIVSTVAATVLLSGILIRLTDPKEIPNIATGIWWAAQTVTTVGYGDVVPTSPQGRIMAVVVMLEAIAFVSIVTAGITSTFVERARREQAAAHGQPIPLVGPDRSDEILARLDRIEQLLDQQRRRDPS
jgi:voltage-gated potassium channel Kch